MKCPRCAARVEVGALQCVTCGAEYATTLQVMEKRFDAGRPRNLLSHFGVAIAVAGLTAVILTAISPFVGKDSLALELPPRQDESSDVSVPLSTLAPTVTTLAPPTTVVSTSASTTTPTTPAPRPPGPLTVASTTASCTARSSTDSKGNPVSFDPVNLVDGDNTTAWRCPGSGRGVTLTFAFAGPFEVTSISSIPGYDRIDPFNGDDRFTQNRRVRQMRWTCLSVAGSPVATVTQDFADDRASQPVATPKFVGCVSLRGEILSSTSTAFRDNVAMSEVAIAGRP